MVEPKDWVAAGTLAVAILVAIRGLVEYIKAQRWKRLEFVAGQVKDFRTDPACRNVVVMLDYNERPVELFPSAKDYADRYVVVTDDVLKTALTYHVDRPECSYTPTETAIRDSFDAFLTDLNSLRNICSLVS